jgi:tRNA(Ile)-lysidine synthase
LEKEGLSAKRLATTAKRMERARCALEEIADQQYELTTIKRETNRTVFNFGLLLNQPEEIVLRVIVMGMQDLVEGGDYGPRMEKIEALVEAFLREDQMKPRTLGGVIFSVKGTELILERERNK